MSDKPKPWDKLRVPAELPPIGDGEWKAEPDELNTMSAVVKAFRGIYTTTPQTRLEISDWFAPEELDQLIEFLTIIAKQRREGN